MRLLSNLKQLAGIIIFVKLFLATVTPLGYDFSVYIQAAATHDQTFALSPWMTLVNLIYDLWLALPLDHGNPALAFADSSVLLPSHYLLTALIKAPLVVSDFAVACLIYKFASRMTGDSNTARRAMVLWLTNPLITVFAEMWGSIDVIVTAFAFGSVVLMIEGRHLLSSAGILAGITLRASPVLTWFALLAWAARTRIRHLHLAILFVMGLVGALAYFLWVSGGIVNGNLADTLEAFFLASSSYTPVTQTFTEFLLPDAFIGIASTTLSLFFLMAAWLWPTNDGWDLIGLALSSTLVLYGLAFWYPTAFLWVMPLLALLNSRGKKLKHTITFGFMIALYVIIFYADVATNQGSTLLFIPVTSVSTLSGLAKYVASLPRSIIAIDPFFLSAFSAFSLAFGASIVYETFARRDKT